MQILTEHQIKEIAEQFDCGFRSFWHKPTATLLFVPDRKNYLFADTELFDEELQKLEDNFEDYLEIEKPDSSDSFEIMILFTEQLEDNSNIKNQLTYALNKKKPSEWLAKVDLFLADKSWDHTYAQMKQKISMVHTQGKRLAS